MTKQNLSSEDEYYFKSWQNLYLSWGLKWAPKHQKKFGDRINEPTVFQETLDTLRKCFNLELSLSQKIELRKVYVTSALRDYKTQRADPGSWSRISFPEREAAARFMLNNYDLTLEHIQDALMHYGSLARMDPLAQRWVEYQQDKMLKL